MKFDTIFKTKKIIFLTNSTVNKVQYTIDYLKDARYLIKAIFCGLWITAASQADILEPDVTVVYPSVREPYATLYRDYVYGVIKSSPRNISEYILDGNEQYSFEIKPESVAHQVFIALGNRSVSVVVGLQTDKPLIAAVSNKKYESVIFSGVILKPSAEVYINNLIDIYPGVKDIHIVYNPDKDTRLIEDAAAIFAKREIKFTAVAARDLREAAKGYRSILSAAKRHSAVWLLSDKNLIDSTLLGVVLDAAWKKKLAVFSSNPVFVKHGALFAIYPDNKKIGYTLGMMAKKTEDGDRLGLEPLQDVRLVVNERTRNHLGIDISPAIENKVELLLPGN